MICLYMHGMGSQAEIGIRPLSGLDRMTQVACGSQHMKYAVNVT